MRRSFFVAGTDTGVGKTLVCTALLHAANKAGLSTAAIKPVAAGGEVTEAGIRNEDAVLLHQAATLDLSYAEVNPIALAEPLAPHIAASREGIKLSAADIARACQPVLGYRADFTVVEGAGGWRVPLNDSPFGTQLETETQLETMADIARHLQLPIILVVGMRLGCLNHALLSAEAIAADGLQLAGWVANRIDPEMEAYQENLDTLRSRLPAPLIAEIPWLPEMDAVAAASYVRFAKLIDTD